MFSLKSPHLQLWDFSKGFKNEFEIAIMVNKPSVLEQLKFFCIMIIKGAVINEIKDKFQIAFKSLTVV